jgi:hypothetical protein
MTRRDQCLVVGRRASKIENIAVAANAWSRLADKLIAMGDMDVPKFRQLLYAIRRSHLDAEKTARAIKSPGFHPRLPYP